ncbi:leucyl/phenylalanyl-tRNA--protein transferase [Moraxella macacae 0408225]|uniref:Leucyl/phenylalanyl-tRNA--protein transferase n=1 Tax=Moraxella macacae 0408225 TaxID=1230338 RepID=L2FA39_9GAMM|nr:leucyl/phenylalanyl-tRNA--protein transferase [Moraxella macacae]ELA09606.1 leucyl/phenylalanyl-tRNA--protein transferase [Moraxella macacae 0408225]
MTVKQPNNYACAYNFPNPLFCQNNDGLIAIGADLSVNTLRYAYAHGMFPWFNHGDPIMWWSPNPRCIIYPHTFKPSKTLIRKLKNSGWTVSVNADFLSVIQNCCNTRAHSQGTWISDEMINAYYALHKQGDAISVEVWDHDTLIGGLYGVKLGQAFFGESMFHHVTDASKAAFFALMVLCRLSNFAWVDCQLPNTHLLSLGASVIGREQFLHELARQVSQNSCVWSMIFAQKIQAKDLLLNCPIVNKNNCLTLNLSTRPKG